MVPAQYSEVLAVREGSELDTVLLAVLPNLLGSR